MNEEPWSIGIQNALEPNELEGSLGNIDGSRAAVATSGVTKRRGVKNGKEWHHIIDPRTGEPTNTDLLTVSVLCDDAVLADVLAKCAVIVGSSEAWDFLEKKKIKEAIFQIRDDNGLKVIRKKTT